MKLLMFTLLFVVLTGCAQYDAGKSVVKASKEGLNDRKLTTALDVLCGDVTVGAVRRHYNGNFVQWAKACPEYFVDLPSK